MALRHVRQGREARMRSHHADATRAGATPQHRVPHNVKWTSFAPPGWTNFAPPLTFSLVRFFDPDSAIAGPVIPFDNLPTRRPAVDAWVFPELAGITAALNPCHRQSREKRQEDEAPEREAPQDFAARMRQAATGIDQNAFADRAAALRDGREAEERHTAQEVAREQERVKELERAQEREIQRGRGRGIGR